MLVFLGHSVSHLGWREELTLQARDLYGIIDFRMFSFINFLIVSLNLNFLKDAKLYARSFC